MKKKIIMLMGVVILLGVVIINQRNISKEVFKEGVEEINIIPKPLEIKRENGEFILGDTLEIALKDKNLIRIGEYLKDKIQPSTGCNISIKEGDLTNSKGIKLELILNKGKMNDEEYNLVITKDNILISSPTEEGIFRGVTSLLMLFPNDIVKGQKVNGTIFKAPCIVIHDKPEYGYRGVMIDVARHFFSKEIIMNQIDILSSYKINKLHLHLSDDQGWRLEIKKYPDLTLIGGSTEVGGGKGGYYTQEDYVEIVNYAKDRFIEIVPEFDMPGHTNAALASYGFLNPDGKRKELYTGIKVGFSTLMTNNEDTYKFIDDVFNEVSAITPGKYFHIGGDEALKTKKEDYDYFEGRVKDICEKYNKIPIGWDPIDTAPKIGKGVVLQNWQDSNEMAVKKEMNILVSLAKKSYLDMKYNKDTPYGLDWAGYISIKDGYEWDITDFSPRNLSLGLEAPLWTETISTVEEMEYMTYPRVLGYAEIGWTKKDLRNYEEYKSRLKNEGLRLELKGVNFYKDPTIWG